jgi:uncharacterized protein (UPF0332 family)
MTELFRTKALLLASGLILRKKPGLATAINIAFPETSE